MTLLERCGDAIMLHLLKHASLFAPLPNGCLLQLSGIPAWEVTSILIQLCTDNSSCFQYARCVDRTQSGFESIA